MFWRTSNNFNFVLYKFINGVKDNAKYNVYFGCVLNIIYLFRWTYLLTFHVSLEIPLLMFKVRVVWLHGRSRFADMCITLSTVYKCHRHNPSYHLRLLYFSNTWNHEGDTPLPPLRTAYRSILALRTAYRHFLASRTAYRLTTKTTILGVSIYIKKLKLQYVVCICTVILETISFVVFAC